jgi:hypothetical protein
MERAGEFTNVGEIGRGNLDYKNAKGGAGSVDVKEFRQHSLDIEDAWTIDEITSDRHKANDIKWSTDANRFLI